MKKKLVRKLFTGMLAMAVSVSSLLSANPVLADENSSTVTYADGTYTGIGTGRNGDITLGVTLSGNKVTNVTVVSQQESGWAWDKAKEMITMMNRTSPSYEEAVNFDGISGATLSSNGIRAAVVDAFLQAGDGLIGSGTWSDPYKIRTAAQLSAFAESVDNGENYEGKYVELAGDIDLSGIESWNPIGLEGNKADVAGKVFAGHFDGQGHTISGLTIKESYEGEHNIGLFSTLDKTAAVSNLKIKDADITVTGTDYDTRAGLIAGYTLRGTTSASAHIDSCDVQGNISLTTENDYLELDAGGILGTSMANTVISNCSADVQITLNHAGTMFGASAGGILGMSTNTVLVNAAATGTVQVAMPAGNMASFLPKVGGIAGSMNGEVWNVVSDADVSVSSANTTESPAGVLFGNLGLNWNELPDTAAHGYGYYASDAVVTINGTKVDTAATGGYTDNSANDTDYTAQAKTKAELATELTAQSLSDNLTNINKALKAYGISGVELKNWVLESGRLLPSGDVYVETEVDASIFKGGNGTAAEPYLIANETQLKDFAGSLGAGIDYSNLYVQLTADLDISGEDWEPIGGNRYAFNGTFDGAGHTISGLTEGSKESPRKLGTDISDYANAVGLFGNLGTNAVVKDLALTNVAIYTAREDSSFVGGIAGYMQGVSSGDSYQGAVIDHCQVSGVISASAVKNNNYVGGIAGRQYKGAIINSRSDVEVSSVVETGEAIAAAGGLVGMNNRGLVANDYSLGNTFGSMVRDIENEIEGMAAVSSLVGVDAGDLINCYSIGDTESADYSIYTGALAGWVTGIGKAYDSYYNVKSTMKIGGVTASTSQAYGTSVIGGVNEEGEAFEGGIVDGLTGFDASDAAAYAAIADTLNQNFSQFGIDVTKYGLETNIFRNWTYDTSAKEVTFADTTASVTYVQKEAEKYQAPERELLDGTWYGRDTGKKVVVRLTVKDHQITNTVVTQGSQSDTEAYEEAVAVATEKAYYGDFSGYGKADTTIFSGGNGTKENPYRVATEAQLRYIAEAMNADEVWEGVYFKQVNNIVLSNKEWIPIGWGIKTEIKGDQVLYCAYPFCGSYDGDNYTISNLRIGTADTPASQFTAAMFGVTSGDYESNELFPEDTLKVELKNIHLKNVFINNEVQWDTYTAGLVGSAQNGVFLDNCSVTGTVKVKASDVAARAAGLASSVLRGGIYNCYTDVDVTAITEEGDVYAGGMFSVTNRVNVVNCYSLGNVTGDANTNNKVHIGGFTGMAGAFQYNCYAAGNVTSNRSTEDIGIMDGRIAGVAYDRNCYFNSDAVMMKNGTSMTPVYTGADVTGSSSDVTFGKTKEELASEGFAELLNTNRKNVTSELEAADEVLGGIMSIYYSAGEAGLNEWKVLSDKFAGFEDQTKKNTAESVTPSSGTVTKVNTDTNNN